MAVAVVLAGLVSGPPSPAGAQDPQPRAATCTTAEGEVSVGQVLVVVSFPGGRVARCAAAGGSGIDVLQRAGFGAVLSGYGTVGGQAAVCAITDPSSGQQVGCQTGPRCLTCASPDSWTYYRCWQYSTVGAGSTVPPGGSIEAWHFGHSRTWPGARPAACDSDGDDTLPTPPPPPPPPPGGGSGATGGGGGGGAGGTGGVGGTGGPATGGTGGGGPPSGPGGTGADDPIDPSAPGSPGATAPRPGGPGASSSSSTTAAGSSTTAAEGEGSGRGPADPEDEAAGDAIAASSPLPGPGSGDDGGSGGGAVLPLVLTGVAVAVLGAVALRLRRRRGGAVAP
ncbi:MAG TPA: hypothetical protein VEW93_08515 [Acidimicrobiales bacterium]|nr:hypothetical protein [Acidimicrobiales bacterium]